MKKIKKNIVKKRFDSALEEKHYSDLYYAGLQGNISELEEQFTWKFEMYGNQICAYTIDFKYKVVKHNQFVADECKGFFHPIDRLRFKLFLAHHNYLGWIVRLQDSNKIGKPFFIVFLSPGGRIMYYDHLDNNKKKYWTFTKPKKFKY